MSEPFFGSVSGSPIWPGIQFPGFGVFQTPVGIGSRSIGLGSEGVASSIPGIPAIGQGLPPAGAVPLGGQPSTYPFAQQPYALGGGMVTVPVQGPATGQPGGAFATVPSSPGLFTQPGGYPAFGAYDVPAGVTAPALLAAVAMRRGQPLGPTNDREIEEFLYDALDLLPGTNEVEVRCEGARVTLTGTVQHKRLKRDIGEVAWAMFGVNDVVNNVNIAARRRARATEREPETQSAPSARKQP
jgi:hypothetical protein